MSLNKFFNRTFLTLSAFLMPGIAAQAAAVPEKEAGKTEISLSAMKKAPSIDGAINESEWKGAARISGMYRLDKDGTALDSRKCSLWVGYDDENMYFAVKSELPPGGKPIMRGGSNVIYDDSIEFLIVPPERQNAGPFQFGFFQLLLNAKGSVWGRHMEPAIGMLPVPWTPEINQAHLISPDGSWEAELAIPLSTMGFKKMPCPSKWAFLFSRNFKEPDMQCPVSPVKDFTDKSKFAVLNCVPEAPSVQVDFAGNGEPSGMLDISVFNPGTKAAELKVDISRDGEKFKKDISLAAGESISFSPLKDSVKNILPAEITIDIKNKTGAQNYYRHFKVDKAPDRKWINTESYVSFLHDFKKGLKYPEITRAEKGKESVKVTGEVFLVQGRIPDSNAVYLPKGSVISFPEDRLLIPGAVSCWIKPRSELKNNDARRYLGTAFKKDGYAFLQECTASSTDGISFGYQYLPGMGDKTFTASARKNHLEKNKWSNITVNIEAQETVLFINGIECTRIQLPVALSSDKLLNLLIGSSSFGINDFDLDEVKVYERTLTPDEIKAAVLGETAINGKLSWFPSLNELILDMEMDSSNFVDDTEITVIVNSSSENKKILETKLDIKGKIFKRKSGTVLLRERVKLPEMQEGKYTASVKIESKIENKSGEYLTRQFIVKHYPWENNKIGLKEVLLPPFTPLKVDGKSISCVLRNYKISGTGFPEQIKSMDKEILAAPIQCVTVKDGKNLTLGKGSVSFTEAKDISVKYTSISENELFKLSVVGKMEFDGFLDLKMNFIPLTKEGAKFDRVYIDIPVKKEFAKLFHACGERSRSNPAGFIPEGKGVVWKSRSIPQAHQTNFIPYIWIGDEERGISYAADWEKNWVHCKDRDAVELIRQDNGNVTIRLNLINGPFDLNSEREIEIALMASPVKPMPEGWRGWSDNYISFNLPGKKLLQGVYSWAYMGGAYGCMAVYPAFGDFTFHEKFNETRKTGKVDEKFLAEWIKRVETAPGKEVPDRVKRGTENLFRHYRAGLNNIAKKMYNTPSPLTVYQYTCSWWDDANMLPEFEVYGDEWQYKEFIHLVDSYRDYAIYYFSKLVDTGIDGIYVDNPFFAVKYTWPTGDGYVDENGDIKPSFGLWRIRNHFKRIATMLYEKGKDPYICAHHTDGNILPVLSFATNSMGMEWKYGETDFQDRFTADYVRTVDSGRQGGFYPTALDGLHTNDPVKRKWLTRTMLAVLLPHEIQPTCGIGTDKETLQKIWQIIWDFGKAEADTKFLPYWDENGPVKPDSKDIIASAYLRGNKLLIIAGNYGGDINVNFKLNIAKFGSQNIVKAINAETGEALSVKADTVALKIKKHDLALIEVILK